MEKAKTTPEQYPLSLNALTNGCNQKSNRSPQMNLDTDQVAESLDLTLDRLDFLERAIRKLGRDTIQSLVARRQPHRPAHTHYDATLFRLGSSVTKEYSSSHRCPNEEDPHEWT